MKKYVFALAAIGVLAVAGSVAYATIPDSNGEIHGCYSKKAAATDKGSPLNIIDTESGATCDKDHEPLTWNQQGPPGDSADVTVFHGAEHTSSDDAVVDLFTVPDVGTVEGHLPHGAAGCVIRFTNESGATIPAGGITQTKGTVSGGDHEIADGTTLSFVFVDHVNNTGSGMWQLQTPSGLLTLSFFTYLPGSGCDFRAQGYLTTES